eukprot:GHVU01137405.1.p2 GENE.GHVU01137405.1~~GHVU01137405.1.p2  ORF type:complete len:106 (+),score=4.47 GHVU01137405.1:3-320(+)
MRRPTHIERTRSCAQPPHTRIHTRTHTHNHRTHAYTHTRTRTFPFISDAQLRHTGTETVLRDTQRCGSTYWLKQMLSTRSIPKHWSVGRLVENWLNDIKGSNEVR